MDYYDIFLDYASILYNYIPLYGIGGDIQWKKKS
jgi:hypothetical protein